MSAATDISVETFLETIVPRLLSVSPKHGLNCTARLVIRLLGDQENEWTVDMDQRTVRQGRIEQPDLYLEMDRTDFVDLMHDELDVGSALIAGRIRFEGRIQLLGLLAASLARVG
ncbi:SCP2 sterol-binding domain-containing protein [Myxococcota bacterium]